MKKKSVGAMLRAFRPNRLYVCAHCSKTFEASDERAVFCGSTCRSAASRARQKAKQLANQEGMPA